MSRFCVNSFAGSSRSRSSVETPRISSPWPAYWSCSFSNHGNLHLARPAPRRPEVDHQRPPLVAGQRNLVAVQIREREGRSDLAIERRSVVHVARRLGRVGTRPARAVVRHQRQLRALHPRPLGLAAMLEVDDARRDHQRQGRHHRRQYQDVAHHTAGRDARLGRKAGVALRRGFLRRVLFFRSRHRGSSSSILPAWPRPCAREPRRAE